MERKNTLSKKYSKLSTTSRKRFREDYMSRFDINLRPFYHRLSGRDKLSSEEADWVNNWKLNK